MATKKRLASSRKYANGTIHEVASGKLIVMDRYLDDDGITMLQYEWLTGDNTGKIEENKEQNINASIHKFNLANDSKWNDGGSEASFMDLIIAINQKVIESDVKFDTQMKQLNSTIDEQNKMIKKLEEQVSLLVRQNNLFDKQQDIVGKLIEKFVK